LLDEQHELVEESADHLGIGADHGDLVAADVDLGVERTLDEPEQFVALAEQTHHEVVARNADLDLCLGHRRCRL
jgi:hypothetical protein